MSPVKSQGRASVAKQRAEAIKKGNRERNVRQSGSKVSQPPSDVSNGKQKGRGDVRKNKRNEASNTSQHEKNSKGTLNKTANLKCPSKTLTTKQGRVNKHPSKAERKREDKETESEEDEEESESAAGGSEETEEETSNDEKEEDRGSHEEPAETQESTQSSEEEAEATDTQRETQQPATEDSDQESSEEVKSRRNSEVEPASSIAEEEETDKEIEESEAVISEGGEDTEVIQEDKSEAPADKTRRRQSKAQSSSKPAQRTKYKMFRKTKADKQAEKEEKQRAKAEKKKLEKEAKQKAKEEKKNKKKPQKEDILGSTAEESRPPKGLPLSKVDTAKDKAEAARKIKDINKTDAPVEADPEEGEDEDEPTVSKAIKGQNRIMLLKAKGKDIKDILEPKEEPDAGSVVKGRPQSLLLGKLKVGSPQDNGNKKLVISDGETSPSQTMDGGSSKPKEGLIQQKKGMGTLHRVSGWMQKKKPKGLNLRKKLSAWTKAIGVSRWLALRAIKQKQSTRKSKCNILKHRMAMRVASKTSLASRKKDSSSDSKGTKGTDSQEQAVEGGEEAAPSGEKEVEAKYAVVLPRMNKLGKAKAATAPPAAPGEPTQSEPKPPKPGARLVLPVKPDLSLLKSIKKPLAGGLTSSGNMAERASGSSGAAEGSSNPEDRDARAAVNNQNGVSVLQAARGKIDPSQIKLTKMAMSGGPKDGGLTQTNGKKPEREATVGVPGSATQPCPNGEAKAVMSGAWSLYEEEADREVAQLMGVGGIYGTTQPEVHWAGNQWMSGDPQVCVTFLAMAFVVFLKTDLGSTDSS